MTAGICRVAIDLGGTKIRAARLVDDGRLLTPVDVATPTDDLSALLDAVEAAVERCGAGVAGDSGPRVIGLGMPGVVDRRTGRLTRCQNIPVADGSAIHQRLAHRLQAELRIDNDVNLAAVGERVAGSAAGTDDLVVLSLGTGVGAGIVSGGQLLRGARGLAAELADLPLFGDPWDPVTRQQGPLEHAIGSAGIMRSYHAASGGGQVDNVEVLFSRVGHDAVAAAVVDDLVQRVAVTILALQAVVDPAVVVLTGGIGAAPLLADRVRAAAAALLGAVPEIHVSALGAAAGLHGAAALSHGTVTPWVTVPCAQDLAGDR